MEIIIPVIILGLLGAAFGIGLAFASKKLHVETDPKLEKIQGLLPGANCGACGQAGCFGLAEAIIEEKASVEACRVLDDKNKEGIAKILGQKIEKKVKQIAVLHCNGGKKIANRFKYQGPNDCVSAIIQLGGFKECVYGCLGLGNCVRACPFGALSISDSGLPVVDIKKCKACNKCVSACPKKLFSLIPVNQTVFVACRSHDTGKDTKAVCQTGCISCKICEKVCKTHAIQVSNHFAVIDYNKCTSCAECVKACPVKAIRKIV
jgi:Na+-translocating ferredoxin:NAD+ oxidoreductase RNF subunit RnfB